MLIDVIVLASFKSDLLDDFENKFRNNDPVSVFEAIVPRFLELDLDGG